MAENKLKPCDICGEFYPEHTLERFFTGRTVLICESCLKEGRKEVTLSINSNYVRRKLKKEGKK